MEKVTTWYLTDNEHGVKLVETIKGLGLSMNKIIGLNLGNANINNDEINIFIFDILKNEPEKVIENIASDKRLNSFVKFIILSKKEIKSIQEKSFNVLHLEFITRPVYKREFLLLLEKTIIVERYREIMRYVSKEAEARINVYENLMDVNRKGIFANDNEKQAFENILSYEKNLMDEQMKLSKAIKDFTLLRQAEMFDLKKRIKAEEMLADLRRKELMDANNVIGAQESVINYSAKILDDAKKIIDASENVAELSRSETIELKDELERQRNMIKSLSDEIDTLLQENSMLIEKAGIE